LKNTDTETSPAQAKFYNVAFTKEYSISVALALKRLVTPVLESTCSNKSLTTTTLITRTANG